MSMRTQTATLDLELSSLQQHFERIVLDYLPHPIADATGLLSAMSYAVNNGGKRLRPILVYLTGELLGIPKMYLDACAVSLECIHAYSLIHDDLPAMDNSHLRRGKPTCHLAYSEAIAILAGDCLQTFAFDVLINHPNPLLSPEQRLKILAILARVSGYQGMGGGQARDLLFTGKLVNKNEFLDMYSLKTAALIQACMELPSQFTSLSPSKYEALNQFGRYLGLAFQIQDDILDCEADWGTLGKPTQIDARNNKHTLVHALGISEAKKCVANYAQKAIQSLTVVFDNATTLCALAEYLSTREA